MSQINHYNLLRWSDSNIVATQPPIPWLYTRDLDRIGFPLAYPTEAMAFVINGEQPATHPDFASLRLRMVDPATGNMIINIGTLERVFLDAPTNSEYQIFCTFDIPAAKDGVYQLQVHEDGGDIIYTSSYIMVINDKDLLDAKSVYFRFRNDRYFYRTEWGYLPGDFYQQFRLAAGTTEDQLEAETELYKEVTTGRSRKLQNVLNKLLKVETYFADPDMRTAISLLFEHGYLELNGKEYVAKGPFKATGEPLSKVQKGEVELYDQSFASANRC